MEFTAEQQAHIDQILADTKAKWIKDELEPIQAQVEQYKPKEKSDTEKALEQKEQELWNKEKSLILKEHNLHEFADFFNANDTEQLNKDIEKLNKVLDAKKLNSSYIPDSHKQTDAYTQAEKNKDTIGMIDTKLSKIFK
ncbi:hypothetical protein DCCM_0447 [Desulfocucumis palustris]|uniref:Uncharacterized protein n=1 Tax=Desulfocucumis palustris TaxID=1898651 RepID=A0A2L2X8K1_9FIRM|nr:hypothetical protein [Desulfocucumis palustris]GBF32254.1 hypothetical protein DCCM_0447 [Desulfocucumis palustris]